jgi:nucleoid-associated protein YgaU
VSFEPGSRYAEARRFAPIPDGVVPFAGVRPRPVRTLAGAVEHVISEGERLDLLAFHYYGDPRRWYRIVDANPDALSGGQLLGPEMVGRTIIIPPTED